jgi:hypothetical protein
MRHGCALIKQKLDPYMFRLVGPIALLLTAWSLLGCGYDDESLQEANRPSSLLELTSSHACVHMRQGPVVSVDDDTVDPDISQTHTLYRGNLHRYDTTTFERTFQLQPAFAARALMFSAHAGSIQVWDEQRNVLREAEFASIDGCPALPYGIQFDVLGGTIYRVSLQSASTDRFSFVTELVE